MVVVAGWAGLETALLHSPAWAALVPEMLRPPPPLFGGPAAQAAGAAAAALGGSGFETWPSFACPAGEYLHLLGPAAPGAALGDPACSVCALTVLLAAWGGLLSGGARQHSSEMGRLAS